MGNSYMVKNTYAVPQPHIVEHCQGVPTKKEVKNVKKSVKNVKKRGKSALVKVEQGQTTLDSFVVKKRKCVEENSVSKDCERISEEEQNYSFMLQDEEYLERQMRLERVKREKLRWVGVVTSQQLCAITCAEVARTQDLQYYTENTDVVDREVCVHAGGVEVRNINRVYSQQDN